MAKRKTNASEAKRRGNNAVEVNVWEVFVGNVAGAQIALRRQQTLVFLPWLCPPPAASYCNHPTD
jgi:hypothetical protein